MKDFQPLSSLMSNLLGTALQQAGDIPAAENLQQELNRRWLQQAGTVAVHSHPLLFTSGRLVVFVESAAWGNDIRHRAYSLMELLSGDGIALNAIEVKVMPDSPITARRPGKPPLELSPQSAEQMKQTAQAIADPQLKDSLLRLAERATKQKTGHESDGEKGD